MLRQSPSALVHFIKSFLSFPGRFIGPSVLCLFAFFISGCFLRAFVTSRRLATRRKGDQHHSNSNTYIHLWTQSVNNKSVTSHPRRNEQRTNPSRRQVDVSDISHILQAFQEYTPLAVLPVTTAKNRRVSVEFREKLKHLFNNKHMNPNKNLKIQRAVGLAMSLPFHQHARL